jgi:hypothetical protein
MLSYAITTELQLLVAKERIADLAASYGASRAVGSARDDDESVHALTPEKQAACAGSVRRPHATA